MAQQQLVSMTAEDIYSLSSEMRSLIAELRQSWRSSALQHLAGASYAQQQLVLGRSWYEEHLVRM